MCHSLHLFNSALIIYVVLLAIISAYFRDKSIVRHRLEAFNKFLSNDLQQIVRQCPPIEIFSNHVRTHVMHNSLYTIGY